MKHFATPKYWFYYRQLPDEVQQLADKCFAILKDNPRHPSLRLKKIGEDWSVRVGLHYRAIAQDHAQGLLWLWIGHHADYDKFNT
jgi:hypothetical protein